MNSESPAPTGTVKHRSRLKTLGFLLVNVWLVWHLAAIFISPLSVDPAAPVVRQAWRITGPYAQLIYMNHGYHFFAPNPGGSTLLGYELEFEDGETQSGRLPIKTIFPRLLYHRHFMLTEFLARIDQFPENLRNRLLRAYAEQLCRAHAAERVTLYKVYHEVPSMERVLAGGTLDDPDYYFEEPLGTFSWADF